MGCNLPRGSKAQKGCVAVCAAYTRHEVAALGQDGSVPRVQFWMERKLLKAADMIHRLPASLMKLDIPQFGDWTKRVEQGRG